MKKLDRLVTALFFLTAPSLALYLFTIQVNGQVGAAPNGGTFIAGGSSSSSGTTGTYKSLGVTATPVSNTGATEEALFTTSITGGTFAATGSTIRIFCEVLTTADGGSSKNFRIRYGTSQMFIRVQAGATNPMFIDAYIVRTSSAAAQTTFGYSNRNGSGYESALAVNTTENSATTLDLKLTVSTDGTAPNATMNYCIFSLLPVP